MLRFALLLIVSLSLFAAEKPEPRDPTPYEDAVLAGREAGMKGLLGKALEAYDRAIKLDPQKVAAYFFKAQVLAAQRKSEEATVLFTKVIELDPKASSAYDARGWEYFKLGEIENAVADFDRYIALEPRRAPYHWQRGIALYYLGRFAEGRRQFELHQAVNANDVENGVWHFICAAREKGFENARDSMLSISGDKRVPMTEIYELFRGKGTVQQVHDATKTGDPSPVELETRRFYAQLYLGLYYEAKGDAENAFKNIKAAATEFRADHLMGDVARTHFKRLLPAAK